MSDLNQQLVNIKNLVLLEEEQLEKQKKLMLVWSILLTVIVAAYVAFVLTRVNQYAKPELIRESIETMVIDSAENLQNRAIIEGTRAIPPMMLEFKNKLRSSVQQQRVNGNEYLKQAFGKIFSQVEDILVRRLNTHGSQFRNTIALELEKLSEYDTAEEELKGLEIVLEKAIFEEVDHISQFTLKSLINIEQKMENVLKKDESELTERERLIVDFIRYWKHFFDYNFRMK